MKPTEMLLAIHGSPIVSIDTLRPDHLCQALISEADRLGITLDRGLWQPAAAIAAHGMRGTVLELPPRLEEISCDIVAELFDELNRHAPFGCSLGASEGDGSLFLWTLTLEAQSEANNNDPKSRFETATLQVPAHWLSAIVNGDESSFDYDEDEQDYKNYKAFCDGELSDGWHVTSCDEESEFCHCHDASGYGVRACNVVNCLIMRQKPDLAQCKAQD